MNDKILEQMIEIMNKRLDNIDKMLELNQEVINLLQKQIQLISGYDYTPGEEDELRDKRTELEIEEQADRDLEQGYLNQDPVIWEK